MSDTLPPEPTEGSGEHDAGAIAHQTSPRPQVPRCAGMIETKKAFHRCSFVQGSLAARFGTLVLWQRKLYAEGAGAVARLLARRADAHYERRDYLSAARWYLRAIKADPHFWEAAVDLGNALTAIKRYEKALTAYKYALGFDPHEALIYYNMAIPLSALGQLPQSLDASNAAIALDPDLAGAYLNRGHTYSRLHRHADALDDYQQALTLAPDDSDIAWTASWGLAGQNFFTQITEQALQRIAQLNTKHYVALLCEGVIAIYHGDIDVSLKVFAQAQKLEPDQWDPPFWTGVAAAMKGESALARQSIEAALSMGLPPVMLSPLYVLERSPQSDFFEHYVRGLFQTVGKREKTSDAEGTNTSHQGTEDAYTLADYLPKDHDMNNAGCTCSACIYPLG